MCPRRSGAACVRFVHAAPGTAATSRPAPCTAAGPPLQVSRSLCEHVHAGVAGTMGCARIQACLLSCSCQLTATHRHICWAAPAVAAQGMLHACCRHPAGCCTALAGMPCAWSMPRGVCDTPACRLGRMYLMPGLSSDSGYSTDSLCTHAALANNGDEVDVHIMVHQNRGRLLNEGWSVTATLTCCHCVQLWPHEPQQL